MGRRHHRRARPRVRRSFYGKSKAEVTRKVQDALADLKRGVRPPDDRVTVGDYLAEWLASKEPPETRPATYRRYEQIVRVHLVPALGRISLARLTRSEVEAMLRSTHKRHRSAQTVAHVRAVLRTALTRAVEDGIVPRNVASIATWKQPDRDPVRYLDPSQVRTLLASLPDQGDDGDPLDWQPGLGLLLTVAIGTGMRQGELLGLCWSDVSFDDRTIAVRHALQRGLLVAPKTPRSRRVISMPEPVEAALRRQKARQGRQRLWAADLWQKPRESEHRDPADFVFSSSTGWALDGTNVTKAFQAALKQAGLPKMRFHDLRHTTASLMLAQGVHPRVVMELLGHSSIRLTMDTYSHVMPELTRDAADQIGPMLWGAVNRIG